MRDCPARCETTARTAVFTARRCADRIRAGIELVSTLPLPVTRRRCRRSGSPTGRWPLQRRHTTIAASCARLTGLSYAEALAAVEEKGADGCLVAAVPARVRAAEPACAHRPRAPASGFPAGIRHSSTCCSSRPVAGRPRRTSGLAAYTFAIRRLQGSSAAATAARSGEDGVAVLMRYTLRLLTAQQFQRAAALVCAAEVLRRRRPGPGDLGRRAVPDRAVGRRRGVAELVPRSGRAGRRGPGIAPSSKRAGVLQTLACPWCGTKLPAQRDLRPDDDRGGSCCTARPGRGRIRARSPRCGRRARDCRS